MFSRPRPRYDPEVFFPASPDRTTRMGKKLVSDMEQFREYIRKTNAEKVQEAHSYNAQSSRLQDNRTSSLNRSSVNLPLRPISQSVVDPMELRDVEAALSWPQQSNESSSSRAQATRAVQLEDFDEVVSQLQDMNLNIAQLQRQIDQETKLWDLQPDQVPAYLDTLVRVTNSYRRPEAELNEGSSNFAMKGPTRGMKASDACNGSSATTKKRPTEVPAPGAVDGLVDAVGESSSNSWYGQGSRTVAESSRVGSQKQVTNLWEEHRQLNLSPWWETRPRFPDTRSSLLATSDGRQAALPPQLDRMLLLPPVPGVLDDDLPADPIKARKYHDKEGFPAANARLETASHISPDIGKERAERRKTSVGGLKEKLAHSLQNMTKSLKVGRRSIELASGSKKEDSNSNKVSPESDLDGFQSKREGKRPQRQPEAETGSQDLEMLEELCRVATGATKLLQDHERSLLTECICCGDEKNTVLDFSPHPPTYSCEHPIQTCKMCMDHWLAEELAGKGCKSLCCPECRKEMSHEDVLRGVSEKTRAEYDRRLLLMALSEEPEFAWCLAPNCNFGQLNDQNQNYMECAGCKYQQCLLHKIPWHKGESCERYDQRVQFVDENEMATDAMIDDVSTLCPGVGCGWRIQKIAGCDHITCKKCKFQFCYQCRADHREIRRIGNTAHARDCKFHSENLAITWPFNVHA